MNQVEIQNQNNNVQTVINFAELKLMHHNILKYRELVIWKDHI